VRADQPEELLGGFGREESKKNHARGHWKPWTTRVGTLPTPLIAHG
jgi:hypothetical protein